MIIESRRKGALTMGAMWSAVPVSFCAYILMANPSYPGIVVLGMALFTSLIFLPIGVFVYLGRVGILAGFNTMSPSEIKEYNMEKISLFMGISFTLTAFISFFATLVALLLVADAGTAAGVFLLVIMVMVFSISIYASGKRFKVNY